MRVLLILFLIPLISSHHHLPNFTRLKYMRGMKKYVRKLNDWLHLNDLQIARRNKGKFGHNLKVITFKLAYVSREHEHASRTDHRVKSTFYCCHTELSQNKLAECLHMIGKTFGVVVALGPNYTQWRTDWTLFGCTH